MTARDTPTDAVQLRYRQWRKRIFAITWLAYFGFYLTRKSFSVAKMSLGEAPWNWTRGDMSLVDGSNLAFYALGQFAFGVLGDRYGTRVVVLCGMLASILIAVLAGFCPYVTGMMVLAGVQGLCQSTGWAPLARNIGQFFSRRERGWVMGLWMTNYAAGGFTGSALAATALWYGDWPWAFWAAAACLLVVWLLFFWLQVNQPEDVGLPDIESFTAAASVPVIREQGSVEHEVGKWQAVRAVLASPMVWLLALVYFLLKPTRYLIMLWAPIYLQQRFQISKTESGFLAGLFDIAGPPSVIFAGLVSDRLFQSRRMPICVLALVGSAGLVLMVHGMTANRYALGAVLFTLGFLLFIPDSLISGTAAIDFGSKTGASTAAGVINGCGSVGAIIGGTLPGLVEKLLGKEADTWSRVFQALAISLAMAAVVLLPRWNTVPATAKPVRAP